MKMKRGERRENISIVIPTYNGERELEELFSALEKQTVMPGEVVVIDSSSSDNTVAVARRFGAKVLSIPTDEFDHGGARTMAGKAAAGEILVYMTQDAVPADEFALQRLVAPLSGAGMTAVTYGRQLPRADASLFARHLRMANYPAVSSRRGFADRERYGLRTFFTSNSFAAYKKACLAEVGFFKKNMIFGEDTHTVTKLLEQGYFVEYVADALVYHSHNYSIVEEFRRYFDIGVFHARERDFFQAIGNPSGEGVKYVRSEVAFICQNKKFRLLPEFFARNLSKFTGYHLGRRYHLLPGKLASMLSMNRRWWRP